MSDIKVFIIKNSSVDTLSSCPIHGGEVSTLYQVMYEEGPTTFFCETT